MICRNKFRLEIKELGFRNNMGPPPPMVISWFKENGWNFVYHLSRTFFVTCFLKKTFLNSRTAVLTTVAIFGSYLII
jgi:hypothetical protein